MQELAYLIIDGERIDVLMRRTSRVGHSLKLAHGKHKGTVYLESESVYLSEFRRDKLADLKAGKVVLV